MTLSAELVANSALCLLAIEMIGFSFTYAYGSPWWATRLGQIYAVKTVLLTLVLMQAAASTLTDQDYPGRHYVRAAIYVGGALSMAALWVALRRYQREGREQRIEVGDRRSRWEIWKDVIREWAHRP